MDIPPKQYLTLITMRNKENKNSTIPKVNVTLMTQTSPTINDVVDAVKHLGENRDYVIKTIIAVYISTYIGRSTPLWLMIVGNPSSNKTTLVDLLTQLSDIYRVDALTANPFSSGQKETKKDKAHDLIPLIMDKCFIIKEYGVLFGRNDDVVKQLISDLVAIYDGEYTKHSPTRGTVTYDGVYFSHIGCVTPMALKKRQKYMNSIGARFLFLRLSSLTDDERELSLNGIWDEKSNKLSKEEVSTIVSEYCKHLVKNLDVYRNVQFPKEMQQKLNKLAILMARARGIILTEKILNDNPNAKQKFIYAVTDIQIEEPFRALKQLRKFIKCMAIVNNNDTVTNEELFILKELVMSSMPVRRSEILNIFNIKTKYTVKQASLQTNKNIKTVRRNLDELVELKVLTLYKADNQLSGTYQLMPDFAQFFDAKAITAKETESLFNTDKYE